MNRHLAEYRVHRKSSVCGGCFSRNLLQTASEGGQRAAVCAVGSWRPHVRCVTHLECPDSWCSWFCASARGAETPPESSPDPSLLPPLSWAISQDYRRIIPGVILRLYKDLDWSNTVPAKGFPGGTEVKKIHLPVQETKETRVRSLGQENRWRWKWQPTPEFLPGDSHGQRKLAGYSPRGRKESDTNERLSTRIWNGVFGVFCCTRCYHLISWIVRRWGRGPRRGAWEAGTTERILCRPWARVPYQMIRKLSVYILTTNMAKLSCTNWFIPRWNPWRT